MSTGATETASAVQLPSKKRKASHDSAVAATAAAAAAASAATTTITTTTTTITPAVVPRKESEGGSQASEGGVSFKSTLDGTSLGVLSSNKPKTNFPPKKRKASFDMMTLTSTSDGPLRKRKLSEGRLRLPSLGSLDDAALGLGPLDVSAGSAAISDGLIGCDNMTLESHTLDNDHETVLTIPVPQMSTGALDHLEALGDEASIAKFRQRASIRDEEESQASSSNNTMANGDRQMLIEALMGNSFRRRDRLESWGGMSDISLTMGSTGFSAGEAPFMGEGTAAAAAIAASALQRPFLEDESDESTVSEADEPVPSKISLGRDRLYSIASLGEPSVNGAYEMGPDLQLYVAAAMANVGDHLAELAGVVEIVAGGSHSVGSDLLKDIIRDDHSDVMSTASSLPEIRAELRRQRQEDRAAGRARSLSTSSNPLSVDYDAVAAAVDAAEAATGALGLTSFGGSGRSRSDDSNSSLLPPIPSSSNKDDRDMEAMRARARAAAGYIPPENLKPGEIPPPSTKKRPKPTTPHHKTIYNKARHHSYVPEQTYSMYNAANKASSQKWDEMYECLVEFVEEQKVDTRGMTEKERKEVEWDGNVPTTYRTKDGKALGRWINNQRSAKHKGVLKKEREIKLMSTGLKWSVLSTNSWQDMMEELQLYVSEKTKDGSEWDGNVPTNYKIKGGTCLDEDGEERNLGRWINRQRSLYQSGKLRKDREAELEAIGLKWSVLSTTSWQSMYDTLVEYVEERKEIDGEWDGNVPANYKTTDVPPKALGRWINRQRTAHQKHKLKGEFADKLNALGLKWSVHERRPIVPMSQLPTPIKSNVTVVAAPRTAPSNPPGPIAAAAARFAAAKSDTARPDAITSNVTVSATAKPSTTASTATEPKGDASMRTTKADDASMRTASATTKADGASMRTSSATTKADDAVGTGTENIEVGAVPSPALRSAPSKLPPRSALSVPSSGVQQSVPKPTVILSKTPVKVESKETPSDQTPSDASARLASDTLMKNKPCADDEPVTNPILPMKRVGQVHVGK